jgi:hypothetical protein
VGGHNMALSCDSGVRVDRQEREREGGDLRARRRDGTQPKESSHQQPFNRSCSLTKPRSPIQIVLAGNICPIPEHPCDYRSPSQRQAPLVSRGAISRIQFAFANDLMNPGDGDGATCLGF